MVPTLVCIPTFNEAPNILRLIDDVLSYVPRGEVLVVDDASPDGTGDLVHRLCEQNARVHLLRRSRKLGLGTAYRAGFGYSLDHGFRQVITMDADFSHPPARLPALTAAAEAADLTIGSRYVPGGAIVGWPLQRRALSAFANAFARTLLRLRTRDITGGFRCYNRRTVEFLACLPLHSTGYSMEMELLTRCERSGLTIAEIPITFVERQKGKSKLSRSEIVKAFLTVLRLTVR